MDFGTNARTACATEDENGDILMDSDSIFILAALMLKKLGHPLVLDFEEFQRMAADPTQFVIDGQVRGKELTVEFKEVPVWTRLVEEGKETVN